jgi:hypothetical protein
MKILAIDLDKTSLTDGGDFSESDRTALREFAGAGNIVTIASGRMTDSILPFTRRLGIDSPVIAYNGGMVRDSVARGSATVFHEPLGPDDAARIVDFAVENGHHLNYYLDDVLYARDEPSLKRFSHLYSAQTSSVYRFVPSLTVFRGSRPTKLIIIADPPERDRLYDELRTRIPTTVTLVRTNPEYLEFMSASADKGRGLRALAEAYGVARGDIVAIGDGDNDISMLEYSGTGVAVANAKDKVKAAAKLVTSGTNNDSPVTEALKSLGLIPQRPCIRR